MQVCVIKNTETKNVNIPLAAAAGGAAGLALRQFVAPSQQEIDYVLFGQPNLSKEFGAKLAKQDAIAGAQKLLTQNPSDEAVKLFLERAKAKTAKQMKDVRNRIKSAPEEIKSKVIALCDNLACKIKSTRVLNEANIRSAVKHERPKSAFILPFAALGMACAYIYNVIGKIKEN